MESQMIGDIDIKGFFNSRHVDRNTKKQLLSKECFERLENELFKNNYNEVIKSLTSYN